MNNSRAIVRVAGEAVSVSSSADGWRELVARFISSQDVMASSRNLYSHTLSQFFLWIEETGRNVEALSRTDVLEYKDSLSSKGLADLTIGSYIVAVRKFYEWAEAEKYYPNIAKGIKTPKRQQAFKKQHLTTEQCRELLAHYKAISLRDYAITNLALRTGLRTIEIIRLDVEDITSKGGKKVLMVWGKGHTEKDKFVELEEPALKPIMDYLATRGALKAKEPLFVSNSRQNKGERLTTKTIRTIIKDGLKAIGLDGREYTAHSLRHTTATTILKQGGTIIDVQRVLRHTSPVTSQIYTESIEEELRLQNPPEALLNNAF